MSRSRSTWTHWVKHLTRYEPHADYGSDIGGALEAFEKALLSLDTHVCVTTRAATQDSKCEKHELREDNLAEDLGRFASRDYRFQLYSIRKLLLTSPNDPRPAGFGRLDVTADAFRLLLSHCGVSAAFASALSRSYLPLSRSSVVRGDDIETWYILPVRVQVLCPREVAHNHTSDECGNNQTNPFHLLHLPVPGADDNGKRHPAIDVRGSRIALFSRYNTKNNKLLALSVNFMDGRWSRLIEEPERRIKEVSKRAVNDSSRTNLSAFHLIYISTVSRWWSHALQSVNEQLIQYEKDLQTETTTASNDSSTSYSTINKALHATASHLHRYSSELESLLEITCELEILLPQPENSQGDFETTKNQIRANLKFAQELQNKISNILALLFNRIQIDHNSRLRATNEAMHLLMQAQKQETELSRHIALHSAQLAEEMKKDSISMKTIAVMTMFFLPGTSFAALLSMPFFTQDEYLSNPNKIWIWIVLTISSTVAAFLVYIFSIRRDTQRKRVQSSVITTIPNTSNSKSVFP